MTLSATRWQEGQTAAYDDLQHPPPPAAQAGLTQQCHEASTLATPRFACDDCAALEDGKLTWKRDATIAVPPAVTTWPKVLTARWPLGRIAPLGRAVDPLTGLSRHCTPVQGHQARPPPFYKTLRAALLSQATQLGVVARSTRVPGLSVDRLRPVVPDCVREATLPAASAEMVNRHHALPLRAVSGTGPLSSADAQRCGIRASSLLASYRLFR